MRSGTTFINQLSQLKSVVPFLSKRFGRNAGWIALNAGLAGTADVILIPEIPYNLDKLVAKIEERNCQMKCVLSQ